DPLPIRIRHPFWAKAATVAVNGRAESVTSKPGSYLTLERAWKPGDIIQVTLPMSLRTEAMPDNPKLVAFMYGPLVLAADLGTEGMSAVNRFGPNSPGQQIGRLPAVEVASLVAPDVSQLTAKTSRVPGQPMTFETKGVGQPHDVRLVPFNSIFESRYNVYWTVYTPSEWEARKTEI